VLGNMGRTFFKHGEYEDAARALGRSLQTRPGESNLRAYYGYALDRLGEDGLEHLLAAVDDNPGEVIPRLLLGMHWREAGEYASALAQFERAASLDPDNPAVAAELGATYFASGDVRSAIAAYRIAANLARNDPGFWLVLAEFSSLNQIDVASMGIPAARNALALNSGDVTASSALGYAHLISGDPLLGSRLLRRSIRRDPDHPAVQYYYALSMQLAGDSEAARSAFKRVMGLDQDGAYGQLAARYLREQ
jgi:cytochrome c-type biogenesis protein CcmH/NrfG